MQKVAKHSYTEHTSRRTPRAAGERRKANMPQALRKRAATLAATQPAAKQPRGGGGRRWPEDLDREVPEPESFTWHILQDANWNPPRDTHLAWRFTKAELMKRIEAAETERAQKRQCPGPAAAARGPWPTRPTAAQRV